MSASIPVFSDNPKAVPTPKLRALVKFPGNVEATTGISVEKINGTWTFETDWSQFGTLTTFPTSPTNYVLTYDTISKAYVLCPSASVAGIIDAPANHVLYGRKDNGWYQAVSISGDTLVGSLGLNYATPTILLQKTVAANSNVIYGYSASSVRWAMVIGDGTSESGSNAGTNFSIFGYNDAGAYLNTPLSITRNTGLVTVPLAKIGSLPAASFSAVAHVTYSVTASQNGIIFRPDADTFGNACVFSNTSGTTVVGTITIEATATHYNTSSDVRLKEDLKSFDAGRIIDDTEVYNFKWKSSDERSYGVSAQQANEVFPQAVTYDETLDWYGIDYSKYVPILLQELKALRARVAELEGKTTAKPS
jgi:hypothetical protein